MSDAPAPMNWIVEITTPSQRLRESHLAEYYETSRKNRLRSTHH